jgi:hypothetical protein
LYILYNQFLFHTTLTERRRFSYKTLKNFIFDLKEVVQI